MPVVKSIKKALNGALIHAVMWDAMKRHINNLDSMDSPYFIYSFSLEREEGKNLYDAPFEVSEKGWVKVGFNPEHCRMICCTLIECATTCQEM